MHGPRSRRLLGASGILLLLGLAHPVATPFLPACPIRRLTGLSCAGCGATRAAKALLRGEPVEALRMNALFVSALPVLAFLAFRWARNGSGPSRPAGSALLWLGLLVLGFTLLRNLPGTPLPAPPDPDGGRGLPGPGLPYRPSRLE